VRGCATSDDLTILTSCAEAFAEAKAFTPASIEAVAADAKSGASWREELGVCEPSPSPARLFRGSGHLHRRLSMDGGCSALRSLRDGPRVERAETGR
jgi:hypothetical protein